MKPAVLVTVLAVVAAGGYFLKGDGADSGSDPIRPELLFEARRGRLNVTITENGTLVAKDSQKISSGSQRRAEITFLTDEGEMVEQGEVIGRLNTSDLEKEQDQLERDIASTKANLLTAQTDLDIQKTDSAAAIEKAAFARLKAEKELEKYLQGDGPNQKRRLEVEVKQKETEYTRMKKRFEDSQELFDLEYINKAQYEEDEINFEKADVEFEGAKLDLQIFERFTDPLTQAERKNALTDAQREVENAEKRSTSTLRQRQVSVEKSEKILANQERELVEVTEEIAKMTVRSPSPGIVLYGDPEEPWRRNDIKVGGTVHGRDTIFTIPDLRVMIVKLWIHEADINKLSVGLTTTVTMDTYPGVILGAEVSKISRIAGSPDRWDSNPEVKRFEVDVTITADAGIELKPGISAKAEIFVEELPDVLYVPLQCVFLEDSEHFVYALDDNGDPMRRRVSPGSSSDTHRQILDGLGEGDRVLLYNPNLPGAATVFGADDGEQADGDGADGSASGASPDAADAE